jgi:hypothetical protein
MALYGAPVDASAPADATPADVTPPTDASTDRGPQDDGSVMALYGAVPADVAETDADSDASIGVRYGAPPADVWV